MMSDAHTVEDYIAGLPDDRRPMISKLRSILKRRMPEGYHESMMWGAITYAIPVERFPDTYNGQPLCYVALASQKNYCSLYLMSAYANPSERRELEAGFRKAGKKLDMGKSCVRFRSLDDLPLDAIGELIAKVPPEKYLAWYEKSRKTTAAETAKRKAGKAAKTRAAEAAREKEKP
jgi:hypothetical protein